MNRAAAFIIPIFFLVGLKLHNKEDTRDELRQEMVQICEADATCETAINRYFERCFDKTYEMGGRRSGANLDMSDFVVCINRSSGKVIFDIEPTE